MDRLHKSAMHPHCLHQRLRWDAYPPSYTSPICRFSQDSGDIALVQGSGEQSPPLYCRKQFYPVRIGTKIKNRCRAIAKLGYGHSTVWLDWDDRLKQYIHALNEITMLQLLGQFAPKADHPDWILHVLLKTR